MKKLKIAITGPESTGKSTLSEQLAKHFNTVWVPEYARTYLQEIGINYTEKDILKIAKGQISAEKKAVKTHPLVFCDTDMLVLKIWSEYKYQRCDKWILKEFYKKEYDFHFLCGIDLPWEYDKLRENPDLAERQYLFQLYKNELITNEMPFVELNGNETERLKTAIQFVVEMIEKN